MGRKIKLARVARGWDQSELAFQAGVTTGFISHIEIGRKNPSMEVLKKIAEVLGVKVGELIDDTTTDDQSPGRRIGKTIQRVPLRESLETFGTVQYPIVSHIRAGSGTIDKYRIESEESMEGPSDPRYKDALFFEVKGDSMSPRWENGDFVLAHPNMKPKHGDYGVICYNGEDGCLRRIYYQSGKIVLHSLNPNSEPIVVEPDSVWFIGKVVWTKHKE